MNALSLRFKYHAETGYMPLYIKPPVSRNHQNRYNYDYYNSSNSVDNLTYYLGEHSFHYAKWIWNKIEDRFNIWKDDLEREFRHEQGYYPYKNYTYAKNKTYKVEYFEWLENKILSLINKNNLNTI